MCLQKNHSFAVITTHSPNGRHTHQTELKIIEGSISNAINARGDKLGWLLVKHAIIRSANIAILSNTKIYVRIMNGIYKRVAATSTQENNYINFKGKDMWRIAKIVVSISATLATLSSILIFAGKKVCVFEWDLSCLLLLRKEYSELSNM